MKYQFIIYRLLLGGTNNVTSKFVLNELHFAWYLLLRNILASIFIHGKPSKIKALKEYKLLSSIHKKNLLLLSLWRSTALISFYIVLQALPVSFVSVMEAALSILFGVLVGYIFLKEKIRPILCLYIGMIIIGIILTCSVSLSIEIPMYCWIFFILNGLGIAFDSYYTQKLKNDVNMSLLMFAKTESILPIVLVIIIFMPIAHYSFVQLISYFTLSFTVFFLLSTLISIFANFFVIKSIQSIGSTKTIVIQSCMPVIAVVLSIIIYKDTFSLYQLIGLIFVVYGIIQFNLKKQ